jgi:hypothetical protein
MYLWQSAAKEVLRKRSVYEENVQKLFAVVWGQCSDALQEKLRGNDGFDAMNVAKDGVALLTSIRDVSFNRESRNFVSKGIIANLVAVLTCAQGPHESNQSYFDNHNNAVAVHEASGGTFGHQEGIGRYVAAEAGYDYDTMDAAQTATNAAESRLIFLATIFLQNADPVRYGELIQVTSNDFGRGNDSYPRSSLQAFEIMNVYVSISTGRSHGRRNDGVSFHNPGDDSEVALTNAGNKSHITCNRCKEKGHYSNKCPTFPNIPGYNAAVKANADVEGKGRIATTLTTVSEHGTSFNFNTGLSWEMPNTWVLLDNQSTLDVFSNPLLLENIREGVGSMTIHCNAGAVKTTTVGDLPGYGTVWYHPNGIANILSLSRVINSGHRVTYDSQHGNEFLLSKPDGGSVVFRQADQGLFFTDIANEGSVFINTVAENQSNFTSRERQRADLARRLQQIIGRPSTREFTSIVNNNLLPNCPITAADIMVAEAIYGPDLGSLKGKTVRRGAEHVEGGTASVPFSRDTEMLRYVWTF